MCIIAVALQPASEYVLVLASNRDEEKARPSTHPATVCGDKIGGRDLRAGGTWLALSLKTGMFAAITNYRGDVRANAPSRGAIVDHFVDETNALPPLDSFAGFNVLYGSVYDPLNSFKWLSNVPSPIPDDCCPDYEACTPTPLSQGIHVLTNALLDTPWPKERDLRSDMEDVLKWVDEAEGDEDVRRRHLIDKLGQAISRRQYPTDEVFEMKEKGVKIEYVASGEPIVQGGDAFVVHQGKKCHPRHNTFVWLPSYCTRSQTLLLVHRDGRVFFVAREVLPDGTFGAWVEHLY